MCVQKSALTMSHRLLRKLKDKTPFGLAAIFNVTLEVSRDVAFTLNVKHFCQTKIIENVRMELSLFHLQHGITIK